MSEIEGFRFGSEDYEARRRARDRAEDAAFSSLGYPEVAGAVRSEREHARTESWQKHRDFLRDTRSAEDVDDEERFQKSMKLRRQFGPGRSNAQDQAEALKRGK